ncbi:25S rRNA (adenine645-N1)-methyltransferase [Coniosporium apollinis]|uniref:Ribosomal RNA-processing protein 8 n=1 Tax=Coniosporium apollinis TaxID=61459 RepID=A0ABQ9P5C6_9PEZI|nr:25S rRNA (adenine645-N1)-methyltransferase [Coniosporium apollinis]
MFAVPGWNISAPIKAQTNAAPAVAPNSAPNKGTAANASEVSKKRKRGGHGRTNGPAVTRGNVVDLWEQYIEGKPAKKSKNDEAEEQRKQKQREAGAARRAEKQNNHEEKAGAIHEQEPTTKPAGAEQSTKPEKKKRNKPEKSLRDAAKPQPASTSPTAAPPSTTQPPPKPQLPAAPPPLPPATKLTPLQASMRAKLASARFRHLNQTLYTTPSSHSLKLIDQNPEIFNEYHAGFRQQVEAWPENPLDVYIRTIRERGKIREQRGNFRDRRGGRSEHGGAVGKEGELAPLPRTHGVCRIADLGCGDARLASELAPLASKIKLEIKSFDLASPSPLVTKADIADLPLGDGSVDVAIFCLALMGTNWVEFIEEAWRVLRWKGELWVAEIKSRFGRVEGKKRGGVVEHSVGKRQKNNKPAGKEEKRKLQEEEEGLNQEELAVEVDGVDGAKNETDVGAFVEVLRKRGFVLNGDGAVDLSNKMFVRMNFVKAATPVKGKNVQAAEGKTGDGETWKKKPKGKFVEEEQKDEVDESKVLKPCVYKLR